MNNLVDRTYVHAKIHALHGSLLSKEDYREIVRSGKIDALAPGIAGGMGLAESIRAREIVFRRQIGTFILLIGLNDFYSDFFRSFLLLFELNNIKYLLLKEYARKPPVMQWYDVSPYNVIDIDAVKKDAGPDELRSRLEGTVFGDALELGERPSREMLETRLELVVLRNLARFSRRLYPADMRVYNDVMVRRAVSVKMVWEKRCAMHAPVFPQLGLADIFEGAGVTAREIGAVEKEMAGRAAAYAATGPPGEGNDIPALELFLDRLFMSYVGKIFPGDFHSIRPVLSYAWLLYRQILNLFMIIEGFHFKADPGAIMGRLIIGE